MKCNARTAGFTLIELMMTVGIVGILAAIAYPSYQAFICRANRTDATKIMTFDSQVLQRCYSQNFSYATGCNITAGNTLSFNGLYRISVTIPDAQDYTITAVPIAPRQMADTQCQLFTLTSSGAQSSTDSNNQSTTATCWGGN